MQFHHQAIRGAIISLDHMAACQIEHGIAFRNKGHGGTEICRRHVNGGIAVFRSTCIQGQRNLNILHIILRKREHTIVHIGGLRTAAEVHDLEHFIHGSASIGRHRAGTGDKAISIQGTAVINGNITIALHLYKATRASGGSAIEFATLGTHLFNRQAHRTINNQICTVSHS